MPDCALTYDVSREKLTLYIPPLDPDDVIWSGLPLSPQQALEKYNIDECLTTKDIPTSLAPYKLPKTYTTTHPSSYGTAGVLSRDTNTSVLQPAIDTCRVTKTPYEVTLIRHANAVTTAAHTKVLGSVRAAKNEQDFEATFLASCISSGCKKQAYHGIFGSGTNAATLHYVDNSLPLTDPRTGTRKLNLLVDAAAEYDCYCADVTRTFPLSGSFSTESAQIYAVVQGMQDACFQLIRAGVTWEDVHTLAHRVAISGLLQCGILKNGSVDELLEKRTSVAFFPHGLGHYLGMDTHDTGGNPNYGDEDKMFRYLRVRGTLPAGSVVTVEPGIYFCRFIVEPYLKDEEHKGFIDEEVLERYWDVGGVRIEGQSVCFRDLLNPGVKAVED